MKQMDDQISISVEVPLDDDGFLRRECPNCERQFKWFSHEEDDVDAEVVDQYYCPLCGVAAGTDEWWTQDQLDAAWGQAGPAVDQFVQDQMNDAFKGLKNVSYKPDPNFTMGIEAPDPLIEPNDMLILEPPCHPNEPIKVPEEAAGHAHCLVCGTSFAA
jgi:hypothetical protein